MIRIAKFSILLALLLARFASAQSVINGDFENVAIAAPFLSSNASQVPGWTRSGVPGDGLIVRVGYSDPGGSVTVAGHGNQFVILGGGQDVPGTSSWTTTITSLTPNTPYTLSFMIANEGQASSQSITASFPTGSSTGPQTFSTSTGAGQSYWKSWESKTMQFVATATSATLQFSVTNQRYDIGLDYVQLTPQAGGGGGPTITKVQLSTSDSLPDCSVPPAATSFKTTDAEIWVYISVSNAKANDVLRIDFVDPGNAVKASDPFKPLPSAGSYCFTGFLSTASQPFTPVAGNWTVRFYWNGSLLTTLPLPITAAGGGGGGVTLNLQTDVLQKLNLAPGTYTDPSVLAPAGLTIVPNPAGTPGAAGTGSLVVQAVGSNEVHPPGTATEAFFFGPGIAYNVLNCTTLAWTGTGSLTGFTITRPGVSNNGSVPAWAMSAYDAGGTLLSTTGEGNLTTGAFLQPQNYANFTVSSATPITRVVFCSHNGSSTYNALPLSGGSAGGGGGITFTGTYICTFGPSSTGPVTLTQTGTSLTGTLPNGGSLTGTVTATTITITFTGTWTSNLGTGGITFSSPDGNSLTGTWTRSSGTGDPAGAPNTSTTGTVTGTKTPSGGGGNCPASSAGASGTLALARIDVTRNYITNGQPWSPAPPGAVSPGKVSLTPDQRCITSGWNYKWPDVNTGPNHNTASATVALTTVPAGVTPGTSASLAATVNGSWDTTGYGVNRDHTIKLEGAAGTGQSKTASDDPSSVQQTQFTTSNTLTVPAANSGQVILTLNATLRFGDDHTVLTQVDLVYGGGGTGGGGGGGGNPPVTTSPGCSYNVQPADGPGGQPPALPSEPAAGNSEFVLVFSQPGCKFAAYSPVSWAKVTPTALTDVSAGGQGSTTIQIDPQPAGGAQRQTTLTVADKQVTVTQLANSSSSSSCTYTLSSNSSTQFPYTGGQGSLSVTVTGSQCLVQASIDPSVPAAQQWAQITTAATFSGVGVKTIMYQVNFNNTTSARSIKLIVTGTNPAQTLTYTINQVAGPANTNPPPTIGAGGITNAASFITGGPIAQGSFFSIFGSNLGPPNPGVKAASYPLQTTLSGVSLTVSDGKGTTVQALPVFVAQFQINAIMPSNAPLGDVQITATYNGVTGAPQRATVVTSAFGAFAVSLGRGPGIVQNAKPDGTRPLNSAVTTAGPAGYVVVWGTGLGPLSSTLSCAGATIPDQCDPNTNFVPQVSSIQVFIGGVQVNLRDQFAYAARAPNIAGVDQVQFPLPANVPLGCYVPVQVVVNGNLYSNTVTMAINTSGQPCSDDSPLSRFPRDGGKNGFVLLARLNATNPKDPTFNGIIDLGVGEFLQQPAGGPLGFDPFAGTPPVGTCTSYNNIDLGGLLGGQLPSVPGASFLDAGAVITVQGANGTRPMIRPDSTSPYIGLLGGALAPNPKPFLDPGAFTVSGPGGKDVGAFSFNIDVGAPATLVTQVTTIARSQPLVLNWSGGNGANQNILILGYAQDPDKKATGGFECLVSANTTTFSVPAGMLANLPTTITSSGNASGALLFLTVPAGNQLVPFTSASPALDRGLAMYLTGEVRLVAFQ